jgi:UDPglucose 6-dehydrogenase
LPQYLAESARTINDSQAEYVACRLKAALGRIKGSNMLILGLGFRPNVKEDTKSPAYLLKEALEHQGARVSLYDPLYSSDELKKKGFKEGRLDGPGRTDAIILNTAHKEFLKLDWRSLRRRGVTVFVDGRNCFNPEDIEKHGIKFIGIGKGI